jgi:hypothetical protein
MPFSKLDEQAVKSRRMAMRQELKNFIPYEPEGEDSEYIPIEQWGSDHWSTFAYAENCCVEYKGTLDNRKMRCNSRLHRLFMHIADGGNYPTRLKEGEVKKHDDWSCLEDAARWGLIELYYFKPHSASQFGGGACKVILTSLGLEVAFQLRVFKSQGGNFRDFNPVINEAENAVNSKMAV